jgi:hypothetical protein
MASIEQERKLARQAKAAIEAKPRKETVEVLRKANQMATAQMRPFSTAIPLNDARHSVGLALPPLIKAFEKGQSTDNKLDKAKNAIEGWIKHLG